MVKYEQVVRNDTSTEDRSDSAIHSQMAQIMINVPCACWLRTMLT